MNLMKKLAAAGMAVVLGAAMTACHTGEGTKWVARAGDLEVPAGIYIDKLYSQYYTVTDTFADENGALPDKPLQQQIDGVPVTQKIIDAAKEDLGKYIAAEVKFAELGLELPETDVHQTDAMIESYWPYIGTSYTTNGISKESYRSTVLNEAKKNQIFLSIYDSGGPEEVPESELREKFEKDVAKIIVVPLQLGASEDEAKKQEEADKTRAKIDEYYKMLADGTDMEEVYFQARKDASDDPDSVERPEPGSLFNFVIRDTSSYDEKITEAIFNAEIGKPVKVENDTTAYLFMRYDVSENPEDFNSRRATLLNLLRQDAFEAKLDEWAQSIEITYNEEAFKRYTPDKLKVS